METHDNNATALFRFECPVCSKKLGAPPQRRGETIECPGCKQPIRIPPARSIAPPVTPQEDWPISQSIAQGAKAVVHELGRAIDRAERKTPSYWAMWVIGLVLHGNGIFAILMGIATWVDSRQSEKAGLEAEITMGLLSVGVLLCAAGQALFAFRDIARNSFRLANSVFKPDSVDE